MRNKFAAVTLLHSIVERAALRSEAIQRGEDAVHHLAPSLQGCPNPLGSET